MRFLLDIFVQTLRTLWGHKLRSFLTMFGIAWGVGSLLLLIGLGEGFRSGNRRQLANLGQNMVFVENGQIPPAPGATLGSRKYWVTVKDVDDVRAQALHVKYISPVLQRGDIRAVSDFASANGQVFGVLPIYNQIRNLPIDQGRWLNDQDFTERRNVAVIGQEMRKNMFPGQAALGASILLNGIKFQVVGVLGSTGRDEGNLANTRLYVPLSTMRTFFPLKDESAPEDAVSFVNYNPIDRSVHMIAQQEVKKVIARNHDFSPENKDAFRLWDTVEGEEMVGRIFTAMNWFLGSVGIVTLFLGAIGIVNIMLVAVTERTKEIGLRMALGATKRSILTQFFLEGAFLSLVSGVIGLGFAAGFMGLLGMLPPVGPFDPPRLVPWSAALAIGVLSICGVLAGLYPAKQAALLQPVEALRKE